MTDFESIICDNYYYVDKTQYIANIEEAASFFFFVRPPRFKDGFAERNAQLLGQEAVEKLRGLNTGAALLGTLCQSAQNKGYKMYLILDEYDNFANNILVDYGNERYHSITHGNGFFRGFLKVVKDYSNSVIERIFLTGKRRSSV